MPFHVYPALCSVEGSCGFGVAFMNLTVMLMLSTGYPVRGNTCRTLCHNALLAYFLRAALNVNITEVLSLLDDPLASSAGAGFELECSVLLL